MSELTKRQQEIYDFIAGTVEPVSLLTVRDIGAKFDIRSPNGVVSHLRALERKGVIKRIEGGKKGIRVCKLTTSENSGATSTTSESSSNDCGGTLRESPSNSVNAEQTAAKQD